ncbi:MAG: hypothetical protein ACRDN9_11015 [Streptosporangiaceae bacterium]
MSPSSPDHDDTRIGPYATAEQAAADCRLVHVLAERTGVEAWRHAADRCITEADRRHVALGDYDLEVIERVAMLDVECAQSLLGMIARSWAAGRDRGHSEAQDYLADYPVTDDEEEGTP